MPFASSLLEKERLDELARRFRQQQHFSDEYSPLYAALFATVGNWIDESRDDPVVKWLLKASRGQAAFDVSNLLAAALHYEVLVGRDEVSRLAGYYPSVGGNVSPERLYQRGKNRSKVVSPDFTSALHAAILARKQSLADFLLSKFVQTNETGRGISWLLPLCFAGWKDVHLIDLGASAGLNLIADQRSYRFVDSLDSCQLAKVGLATMEQFTVRVNGRLKQLVDVNNKPPNILSRRGCDLHPFILKTAADERILASFIWADQVERMARLKEALETFRQIQQSPVPVRLYSISLPEELAEFLDGLPHKNQEPLVIYNTFVKIYLSDKGLGLRKQISEWAARQSRAVLWIQWEPPEYTWVQGRSAPKFGWLAWTVDLWQNTSHYQFHLGWVHPHGHELQWLPDFDGWVSYWS